MKKNASSINSPLAKVRGLGSAKDGTHHWLMQRVTAIAMIFLTLWFVPTSLGAVFDNVGSLQAWLSSPVNALLLFVFIGMMLYHGKLGMQVVIEDYVHCHMGKPLLLLINCLGFLLLFVMATMAMAKLHFG